MKEVLLNDIGAFRDPVVNRNFQEYLFTYYATMNNLLILAATGWHDVLFVSFNTES